MHIEGGDHHQCRRFCRGRVGAGGISPWTDLALSGASIQGNAQVDRMLDPDSLEMYAKYYAAEQDRTSPLISPLFADLSDLPPLLIQVGTDEI